MQLTLCTIIAILFVCCTNGSQNKNINTSYSIDDVVVNLETMCLTYQNKNIVFSLKERTNTLVNDYQLKFLGSLQLENEHYELLQKTILSGQEFDSQRSNVSIVLFLNYCCPIKPPYTAISSLNPAEIGMISSYFKFQAPLE